MELHNTLPFTSAIFFAFVFIAYVIMLIAKQFFSKVIAYQWVLALIATAYLALLYPKPFHFLGLIIYLYVAVNLLRKYYKKSNVLFPMLILAVPIFLMKTVNVIDWSEEPVLTLKNIFQIAGLSYVVFKVIGLYIDDKETDVKISFLSFFNFAAFVPTLLIGPIDNFRRFQKDVDKGYDSITWTNFNLAWEKLIVGLLYKFIIAEAIRRLVLVYLVNDGTLVYHLEYMYTYLLYLFFDFAGYSLLAISFGHLLGITVPINFDQPFLALNPKEFWKKWHKSLGDWLNNYFFRPIFKYLTKKKIYKPITRQNIALMSTFTLMGFWNGFQLHYIASGMLFGVYSVLHNYYIYRCKKSKKDVVFGGMSPVIIKVISIFLMVNSVAFAIYIFSGKLF
ncbi:MAG: hypothetical protein N4A35_11925 [Flavobacteriales bacterium]|jgi:membrane protein involved in D-alanine export|nr:hypothetical protein [Flavobacteriales bacterium]